ncbi:MAG: hypothetical protein ACI9E1_000621, partial [Cryomorphaceae bacterium]
MLTVSNCATKNVTVGMCLQIIVLIVLNMIPLCHAAEAEFISVSPENTTLLDGSPISKEKDQHVWKYLPKEGNGGVLESSTESKHNAPPLRLMVKGLKPQVDYEVFGFFWATGFGKTNKLDGSLHWPARFGLGMASITTYGGKPLKSMPWIISPASKIGNFGVSAVLEKSSALNFKQTQLSTSVGDTRLIRARVGVARSDAEGSLPIFMDDFPDSIHCGRTRIDGVAVRLAPKGSEPSAGAGDSTALHHALRANDWFSVERELAAGADVNTLDLDGLCPLFHPTIFGDHEMVHQL